MGIIAAAPLISAGASAFSGIYNAFAQGSANRKNRQFTREMYDITRRDSLADWHMQNEYNSPTAQMQRLRDANLNPNLVYGTGTVANNAGVPRSPSVESMKYEPPQLEISGVGQGLMSYYDIQMKEAQTKNLETQNTVYLIDGLLKLAQKAGTEASTLKTKQDTKMAEFEYDLASSLKSTTMAVAEQQLKKLQAETGMTLSQVEINKALAENTIAKGAVEILKMRSEMATNSVQRRQLEEAIKGIMSDNVVKELDAQAARAGLTKDSPWYIKLVEQTLDRYGILPKPRSQTLEDVMRMKLDNPGHGPKTPYYKKVLPK